MKKFSVVVPVYKTEAYLSECVESILSQTYKDLELILVDDGSPDCCPIMCDEFAARDSRVTVIHKPNEGSVSARKIGIEHSTGEYVFTIDSDDYISTDCLAQLNDVVKKYNPDIIKLNFRRISDKVAFDYHNKFQNKFFDSETIDIVKESFLYDKQQRGINFGCAAFGTCSTVAKREIIQKYQSPVPSSITMGDDLAVTAPMIFNAETIFFLDGIQYFYRDTPGSIVNSFDEKAFERLEILIRYLFENVPEQYYNSVCVYAAELVLENLSRAAKCYERKEYNHYVHIHLTDFLKNIAAAAKVYRLTYKDAVKLVVVKMKKYTWLYDLIKRKG